MLPRARRPLEDSMLSNGPMNKSDILSRVEVEKSKQEDTKPMKKSALFNKTSSNTRVRANQKLQICTHTDISKLREHSSSSLNKGLHTNKAGSEFTSLQGFALRSQREYSNENVNMLNKRKDYTDPEEEVLSETLVNDGKQIVVSKSLRGKLLAKATLQEINQNMAERKKVYPLLVPPNSKLINYQPTKSSVKPLGTICSYAANTNQGISRNYNQDRVSIILNVTKKSVKCSYFAIYDGHGGSNCCDYLRDTLHDHIINHQAFPEKPRQALSAGIRQAENTFLAMVRDTNAKEKRLDRSGSCAIITMIIGDQCYVANVGDSRAVLSADSGKYAYNLSRDHKPTDTAEQRRIEQASGKIYKTQIRPYTLHSEADVVSGPLRVFPGKLSVTRTFGDIQAKDQKLGGNHKVVISQPQIKQFDIKPNHDFIILGSDGIFDKLQSKDVVKIVWQTVQLLKQRTMTIHQIISVCVQQILRQVMNRRSLDNITIVMIAFKNFQNTILQLQPKKQQPLSQTQPISSKDQQQQQQNSRMK